MSKISKEGFEQIQIIKNALDSMYDKLNRDVFTKNGKSYKTINLFNDVNDEFSAIAGIVEQTGTWEEVQ